jgi:hypothetical protein
MRTFNKAVIRQDLRKGPAEIGGESRHDDKIQGQLAIERIHSAVNNMHDF